MKKVTNVAQLRKALKKNPELTLKEYQKTVKGINPSTFYNVKNNPVKGKPGPKPVKRKKPGPKPGKRKKYKKRKKTAKASKEKLYTLDQAVAINEEAEYFELSAKDYTDLLVRAQEKGLI